MSSWPFVDLCRDPVAGKVAVCETRPLLPPLPDDRALLAEGARFAFGKLPPLDRAERHENMGVEVFPVALPRRMDCPIRDEALACEGLAHKVADEEDLLRGRQFVRKRDFEAMGKLRVVGAGAMAFGKLQTVPKLGPERGPRG